MGPGSLAPHTEGLAVPVTVPDARRVYVVAGDGMRTEFPVPGDGPRLQGLNDQLDYCFAVLAVYSTTEFASSAQTCTSR